MRFDPAVYGDETARILALDGSGLRLMPMVATRPSSEEARTVLKGATGKQLFPNARSSDGALAGLFLYFSCFHEAHQVAQEDPTAEGSFWHAILHRQEPDPGNSAYWFRRVGKHPVFATLAEEAGRILERHPGAGFSLMSTWDPFSFIDFCEHARRQPGSQAEAAALEIQSAEWQVLFDYCARPVHE
jgi:hypothetical protein